MSTIDEMLRDPADKAVPPLIRWLRERLNAGDELRVELYRSEAVLGSSTVELVMHRKEDGKEREPRGVDWDDDLNAELINLGIRAIDLINEGERFAFGLRAPLQKVARRYGDGYLNAVLIAMLDESDFGKDAEIAEVRKHVHATSPERTRAYQDSREQIASAIGARVVELRDKLGYGEDDLKTIMSKAIARYLDDRFSVSARRALGWL